MNAFFALLPTLLRTLAGANSLLSPHVGGILGAVAALIEKGQEVFPAFKALTDHVSVMATATPYQMGAHVDTLNQHIAAATAAGS